LVLVEERGRRSAESIGQNLRAGVAGGGGQVLEALRQGEELTEAVPAQVVLRQQLLHVLRGRAAGTGLEQAAAVDQRHHREHFGAGAQFQDGEQVGEVVAQHVPGHRDGVLAAPDAFQGVLRGLHRGHDLDLQAVGVVIARYSLTLAIRFASCARDSSSQNTAGVPVARARVTASLTQSRIGVSLVWQARQMSPGNTSWLMSTSPEESTTSTRPCPEISKVLSWLPYSSALAAIRPTFGTEPIVVGSKAPLVRQSSITAWYTPA